MNEERRQKKNKRSRELYHQNIEQQRLRNKIWRHANKENCRERDIRNRGAQMNRKIHLKRKYGINQFIYEKILQEQQNLCAICNINLSETIIHIDHCHSKNIVRGLLCNKCNLAIGLLRDDPDIISSASNYVLNSVDVASKYK